MDSDFKGFSGTYNYMRGRQLEGTFSDDPSIGMWGISGCRIGRGWGCLSRPLLPVPENWPPDDSPEFDRLAKPNRILLYQRIRDAKDACHFLARYGHVSASFEITSQWFDAPNGEISIPEPSDAFVGGHAVSLCGYHPNEHRFKFANSWGEKWGVNGYGSLPYDFFDQFLTEAWCVRGICDEIPVSDRNHTQLIQWGLPDSLRDGLIHLVEMYDPRVDERLGWAFATERDGYLDIEDLFVKPQYRHQGIGTAFANALVDRSNEQRMPLRMWISHADAPYTSASPIKQLLIKMNLANVEPSGVRWASYLATGRPTDLNHEPQIFQEPRVWLPAQMKAM